ncbi:MAG TPA: septal ring lytic transglycosylase RlpA family protein [Hyphomicrobiaceae bacterium]|nr:septal ring lytic transglycosylase RlpA family protein [Hyphomicrobiaceae bacterium]
MRKSWIIAAAFAGVSLVASAPAHAQVAGVNWPASAFEKSSGETSARSAGSKSRRAEATTSRRTKSARSSNRAAVAAASGGGSTGMASYYWPPQRVASGGWFNPNAMTAAHKTLPFGTRVRVTHLGNGRSVDVTINDRGPYIRGRIIDLSRAAAGVIGMQQQGVAPVRMQVVSR